VSLALPAAFEVEDAEALMSGLAALAAAHGVSVVGGNIARSPGPLVVDVTAGGEVSPRKWLTRGGARPGDQLWLSGTIGGARAGLEMLRAGLGGAKDDAGRETCITAHRRPEARIRLGVALARTGEARAAMDLSDGLADAVRQLAHASGCGARVGADTLPIAPGALAWWSGRGVDAVTSALSGGEDYELLFAVPPRWGGRLRQVARQVARPALTHIGTLTKSSALVLVRDGKDETWPEGFEHFREPTT
jgi:thiamine-monophosphate kinase